MKLDLNNMIKYYLNFRGWKTDKKIIVFESDDWGSIRMPSKEAYLKLSKTNARIANDPYSRMDSIAQRKDLEYLFEILLKYKDIYGNHPVITANTIVANPDFDKIRNADFKAYFYETFDKTIIKLNEGKDILKLWDKGLEEGIFKPQLHGREHLNVPLWLEELKLGNKHLIAAFNENCYGIPYDKLLNNNRQSLMAALDYAETPGEFDFKKEYVEDAARIFKNYFGYDSLSFIAPAYIWHHEVEKTLKKVGVEIIQGLSVQYIPTSRKNKYKRKLHYIGQKNEYDQRYVTRNAFFEPSSNTDIDWIDSALNKINTSFENKKPAIIGVHRINFIGSLIEENRNKNLKQFESLIKSILKYWEDVEFLSTDQLGKLILNRY